MAVLGRARALWAAATQELDVYRRVLHHPRTPRLSRWLLAACVAYALSPVDLIPDFIPVLGQLDDALVVPLLAYWALRVIPPGVVEEVRAEVRAERLS